MKKRVLLLATLLLAFVCLAFCSCNFAIPGFTPGTQGGNQTSDIKFENATVTYDGTPKSLVATNMPEGTVVTYTGNEKTDAGVYTVTATFTMPAGYAPVDPKTATLTIEKAAYSLSGISLADASRPYNKAYQQLTTADVVGTLPAGVTAIVSGTPIKDVGSSEFTLSFLLSDELAKNYTLTATQTATLTVTKADVDMSGISFADKTVKYSGSSNSITVTGKLPDGVSVSYVDNMLQGVGSIEATAVFSVTGSAAANYNVPEPMTATLTVTKGTIDVSGIKFENKVAVYNGRPVTLEISGNVSLVNLGIQSIRYENNTLSETGEITATVHFVVNTALYEQPAPKTAKLKVIDCTEVAWDYSNAILYDGTEKTVLLKGLPEGVTAVYSNNKKTDEGIYTATATLTTVFEGETVTLSYSVPQLQWQISAHIADVSGLSFENASVVYNGMPQKILVNGELPEGIAAIHYTVKFNSMTYSAGIDAMVNVGTYVITATFEMEDEYAQVPPMVATFTITPYIIDMSEVAWDSAMADIVGIAGETYTVTLLNLPAHVKAIYEGNVIDFGTEDVVTSVAKVTFEADENYALPEGFELADFEWSVSKDPWTPSIK